MNAQRVYSRRQVVLGSAGMAAFALAPGLFRAREASATVDMYVVNSGGLRLRSGPGTSYRVLAALVAGTNVEVIAWKGWANGYEWAQVAVSSLGIGGYVATQYISPRSSAGGFEVGSLVHVDTASGGGANMRSQAGISSSVIRVMANGSTGEVLSGAISSGGYQWVKVWMGASTGWMATSVLASGPGNPGMALNVTVVDGPLNVRAHPNLSAPIAGVVQTGDRGWLTQRTFVVADGYEWAQVTFQRGPYLFGWVAKKFLSII